MEISKEILEKLGVKEVAVTKVADNKHDALKIEREHEMKMMAKGVARFHKSIDKAKSRTNKKNKPRETTESVTIYGQQLVQTGLEPLSKAINTYYCSAMNGEARKLSTEIILLTKCIPIKDLKHDNQDRWDGISFIVLKSVLDSITVGSTQNKSVIKISTAVEDEARLGYFKEQDSKQYNQTKEWLKKTKKKNYRHNRRVFRHSMNRHELEWKGFSQEDKVKLGKLLLELLIIHTGFVQYSNKRKGTKILKYVQVTPKTLEYIDKKKFSAEVLKPMKMPMIVEPQDWTTPYNGGYYVKQLRPPELSSTVGELNNQNAKTEEKINAL